MPKPILVMHMGNVQPERLQAYADFMYTSEHTKALREEYHFVIRDQTEEEKCYIISTDEPPYDIDPVPHTINKLKEQLSAYAQSKVKPTFTSGGIVSGPSFGNTDRSAPEMVVPMASPKVREALRQMHIIRDAARFLIAELKKGWTSKEIAEWDNVPDIKIGDRRPARHTTEINTKSTVKDPNEKASFFGYKIRRSTMQDLESLMLTGGHASFKASDDGEIFITHAFPRGL